MKVIKGDLIALALDGQFDVIVHGCNCQCAMGAGIALTIKNIFPEAYEADLQTRKGDASKLGTFTQATVHRNAHSVTIVNGYTQDHYRGRGVLANYDAIRSVFAGVARDFPNARIGYPLIGAGLAKGDWSVISTIIDTELAGMDHTLVEYAPG